jgi:hypothetical protein
MTGFVNASNFETRFKVNQIKTVSFDRAIDALSNRTETRNFLDFVEMRQTEQNY